MVKKCNQWRAVAFCCNKSYRYAQCLRKWMKKAEREEEKGSVAPCFGTVHNGAEQSAKSAVVVIIIIITNRNFQKSICIKGHLDEKYRANSLT